MTARGPAPLSSPAEDDTTIDLGLKPLTPAEDEDSPQIGSPGGRRLDLGAAPSSPPPPRPNGPVSPPPPARSNMPSMAQAMGRTWYCRWCGMNSEDPNSCSWCRRDLRSAPVATGKPAHVTVTHAPGRGKPVRQPVGKQAVKTKTRGRSEPLPDLLKEAQPKPAQNGAGLPKAAPQIGTFQAAKSRYYSDQVVDPVSGAHYNADTGATTDTPVEVKETVETNDWVQLGIYSGVFAVLLVAVYIVGTSVIRGSVAGYFTVLAISSFLAGILLPILRVAPWPKDDSEDVGWAMGIIPLFGPFAGTMGYGVLGVVRQDVNPAILGVFITSLLLRVVLDLATGHSLDRMVPFRELSGLVLGAQVMPFVTLAGWYSSEMFHKPDE
jgi:hypothetical protein